MFAFFLSAEHIFIPILVVDRTYLTRTEQVMVEQGLLGGKAVVGLCEVWETEEEMAHGPYLSPSRLDKVLSSNLFGRGILSS